MKEWLFRFTEQIKAVTPKCHPSSLLIVFAAVMNLVKDHAPNSCLCDADYKGLMSGDCQGKETWPGLLCKEFRYSYIFQKKNHKWQHTSMIKSE